MNHYTNPHGTQCIHETGTPPAMIRTDGLLINHARLQHRSHRPFRRDEYAAERRIKWVTRVPVRTVLQQQSGWLVRELPTSGRLHGGTKARETES